MASGHDGRFAPSPTGPLHLGNLRTALVAWLFARANGGRFLLRVDDLDPDRSRPEHEVAQLDDLRALGIDWDGDVVRQSERLGRYDEALAQLHADGLAYPCFCTRAEVLAAATAPHGAGVEAPYPGTCARLSASEAAERVAAGAPHCIRARAGSTTVGFDDVLLGRVETVVDDFVVRRRDGVAAYNLESPVDEADLQVEEVVRGADLAPTTPRQVWIAERLGLHVPSFAHVALVLGPDGARLAKRHGAASLGELADRGIDAASVLRMLAASIGIVPTPGDACARDLVDRFRIDLVPRTDQRIDPAQFVHGAEWSRTRIE